MEEPEKIIEVLDIFFQEQADLQGKKVLITAGPTYEKLDPVRFIGNYSSGKMGIALAEECARRGATIELVCGPVSIKTHHPNIHRTNVESAAQMYKAATKIFPNTDAAILCAAVADFTPAAVANNKIKREGNKLTLELAPTKDIAQALGKIKKQSQVMVGFALETNDEENHAKEKLQKKNLDFIVLNSLQDDGAGFQHDTNKVTLIDKDGKTKFPLKSKNEVAKDIINKLVTIIK